MDPMDQQEKPLESSRREEAPPPPPRAPRARGKLIALAAVLVVAGIVLLRWHPWNKAPENVAAGPARGGSMRHGGPGAMANLPQPVTVATAANGDMPVVITALGTVTPLADVTVRTQLSGTLQSVNFQEGQMVKAGDVLAQIDPRPWQISLENAEGQLVRDQALLATARLDLKRYQTLLAQDSIASQQVDTQASLVKQYEGTVKSDQANIDTYKLDLIYARITAPVSGRVGLRQVDPGNYVTPGDTNGIVVLTQLQPISVIFTASESDLPAILKQMRTGAKLPVAAYDRSNTTPLESGELATIDNQIDTTTGTVKLRANFANPEQMLFPNQFVNARLTVDTIHNAVIVPTAAVLNGSQGQYVYVVKPDNTVTVRLVKVGPVDGERTSIATGLDAGERVVTDGSDRLREGAKITIPAEHPRHASGAKGASAPWGASGAHRHHRHASQPEGQ
jgi:membrane fusion protein, multidrug efflux system